MAGSPQQRLAIRTVIENYERLMHKDHYNFLCISPKARDGDIKTAYFSLVKEMHPDNLTRLGIDLPEVHELAKAVFGKLNEAYNTLKDFNRRLEYDQELETGAVNTRMMRSGKVRRSKDAQTQNTMAESYLKKGQYQKAEEHFRLAIEFDDEVPEYHTALAWCVATNPRNRSPKMIQRGKEILSETVKRFHHAEAAYRLGLLCMRDDDYHTALQLFDKTLKMDPDHEKPKESQVVILRLKEEQEALAAKIGRSLASCLSSFRKINDLSFGRGGTFGRRFGSFNRRIKLATFALFTKPVLDDVHHLHGLLFRRDVKFALVFVFTAHFSVAANPNFRRSVFFGLWVHFLKKKHHRCPRPFTQAVLGHFFDAKLSVLFPVYS